RFKQATDESVTKERFGRYRRKPHEERYCLISTRSSSRRPGNLPAEIGRITRHWLFISHEKGPVRPAEWGQSRLPAPGSAFGPGYLKHCRGDDLSDCSNHVADHIRH